MTTTEFLTGLIIFLVGFATAVGFFWEEISTFHSSQKPEPHSPEEQALADFLDTRQAINEDFLFAQKHLLQSLFDEKRRL